MSQEVAPIRLDFRSERSVHGGAGMGAMNRDMPARTMIHSQQHVALSHPRSPIESTVRVKPASTMFCSNRRDE
jgi:hypothetical protein